MLNCVAAEPWSHRNFDDAPGDFRFAIVPDRSGGDLRGAFTNALRCVDMMRPEFVMTVGDLITGVTTESRHVAQQTELTNMVSRVRAPFFYVVGNHDICFPRKNNPKSFEESSRVWKSFFGENTHYSFSYKGCFFLVLDTMDVHGQAKPGSMISERQYAWAAKELEKSRDARWTFVFMHDPGVWASSAWLKFEKTALAADNRRYSVFAGDKHQYAHFRRHGRDYYVLSVAGGVSTEGYKVKKDPAQLWGPEYGEMDHITWVTMKDDGPSVVNLKLDGIFAGDYINHGTTKSSYYGSRRSWDYPPRKKGER